MEAIVSEKPGSLQALTRAAVDAELAKRVNAIIHRALADVAVLLFRRERKDVRATVDDIRRLGGDVLAQSYETDAVLVMRMRDPLRHREAAYYAANAATPGGIGSLSLAERQVVIEQFDVAFRAYRDAQSNRAHPDVMARLGRLMEADQAVTSTNPNAVGAAVKGVH